MSKSLTAIVFFIILVVPAAVKAQLNHFIYLQTEGRQPFYVKLDKKVLSSSATGYLIIPRLKDGSYNITIGFAKTENSEQVYTCSVSNKDLGYLIKNFGEKGWGLFNLQTLDIVMAGSQAKEKAVAKTEKTDEFSNMLSDVVNDPTIKQTENTVIEKPAVAVNNVEPKAVVKPVENEMPVGSAPIIKSPGIIKKQVVKGKEGIEITYIDITGGKEDTVRLLISLEKTEAKKETTQVKKEEKPEMLLDKEKPAESDLSKSTESIVQAINSNDGMKDTATSSGKQPEKLVITGLNKEKALEDKKFLPIEVPAAANTEVVTEQPSASPMINSDCKNYATEEDFLKLRRKMAGAGNDDGMIAAAQKSFKGKCYSTEQIKNLSVLFLKDEAKYRFFDLSYQYVSDSHNFGSLESLLSEAYYISRFKAMIRH